MIVDRYYYGKLPDNEKMLYREIYQGCMEHRELIHISASDLNPNSYSRIFHALMNDNPLLYFMNQSVLEYERDPYGNDTVKPQYFFSADKVADYNEKIQDAVNRIIYSLKLMTSIDSEKVRKVHDYICENIAYDYEGSDSRDISRFISSHNIAGVFAHKRAQCEGIAKAVKVLLNAVDVPCMIVSGQGADNCGTMRSHCWNIVKIEGNPYHLDVTFDIGAGNGIDISYDYYNVTDMQIRRDHVFADGLPKCTESKANYFEQENLVFSSRRKLQSYVVRQIKNGSYMLYFRLEGKLKAREVASEITDFALGILYDRGETQLKCYQMINDATNTCRISFR